VLSLISDGHTKEDSQQQCTPGWKIEFGSYDIANEPVTPGVVSGQQFISVYFRGTSDFQSSGMTLTMRRGATLQIFLLSVRTGMNA
jgi:hypothetical protein